MKNSWLLLLGVLFIQCQSDKKTRTVPVARKVVSKMEINNSSSNEIQKLSEYSFFEGKISDFKPAKNVHPYELNTPLFTDYAFKGRFLYLPSGKKMNYKEKEILGFESGSIIIKNFYYPEDFKKPDGDKNIIETRLLIKEENDDWKVLSYVWDDKQEDAHLNIIGGEKQVSWKDYNGKTQNISYVIPNQTQCKSCHMSGKKISPIGPIAGQLNRNNIYHGMVRNQLEYFESQGLLTGLPEKENRPYMPVWNQLTSGSLEDRAKAYLHINCAHCHSDIGPAKNSGLNLTYWESDGRSRGVFKPPIAAGKGSGDLKYSIVPGQPENSILTYRLESTDPGVMMPEIGRTTFHKEGLALIESYIKSL